MAYIEIGDERIKPASAADLDSAFAAKRIFGIAVHQDAKHALQATVTGDSALVQYVDQKKAKALIPRGDKGTDRQATIGMLKLYLQKGELDPDYELAVSGLPTVSTGRGCGPAASVLVLVAFCLACTLALALP